MRNCVHLITYADRIGGNHLEDLQRLLDGPLKGIFGGVHILPFFYPVDGADTGFDPIDHSTVDPRIGTWNNINILSSTLDITADLIVNHISSQSRQFQDYLKNGDQSPYNGMFLTFGSVFPNGATEEDLMRIYRPRPGLPFTTITHNLSERPEIAPVDNVHESAGRSQRAASAGGCVLESDPATVSGTRHQDGSTGRGRVRYQEGGDKLFHDPRYVRFH
jgi:hypothetical protein